MKRHNNIFIILSVLLLNIWAVSCTDEGIDPDGKDKETPEELKEGYSLTFRMGVDPLGGLDFSTRGSTNDLKEIEDFVDLEKVRVFFFTCQYDEDDEGEVYTENGKTYYTGKKDYFLFESSSRWVTESNQTSANASKVWQITIPVFPYGNQDKEYNWERVREALTTKPFKIVILANRPPSQPFPDYDKALGSTGFRFNNQGPYWDENDSWANNTDLSNVPTINDLHHCQWDPVYASKNSINGVSGTSSAGSSNGNNIYDFIMGNPVQTNDSVVGGVPVNQMGAVSSWTIKKDNRSTRTNFTTANQTESSDNYFVHPKKNDASIGGIPMYGVQIYDPVSNWAPGTPFNISVNQVGQDNSYFGKSISLLRSVVRLDLLIPKKLKQDTKYVEIKLEDVCLRYPNVMARVVPLDAATPTNVLWSNTEENGECEWFLVQDQGPIINTNYLNAPTGTGNEAKREEARKIMMDRMGWYYGAWSKWWNFNEETFNMGSGPYPHMFNPCVQRNSLGWLDDVLVPDEKYYHYVVYAGERFINDPSNFRNLQISASKICLFQFTLVWTDENNEEKKKVYQVAVTDYAKNKLINSKDEQNNYKFMRSFPSESNQTVNYDLENAKEGFSSYRDLMVTEGAKDPDNYNWALLRNHIYRFQITSFGDLKDEGVDGMVISTEERASKDIYYY